MTQASQLSAGDLRNAIDALPAALDPERLREIGLDTIRRLAAETWTDHLAHDPGITILESLAYAVADVAYRSQFPIADLGAPSPNQPPIPQD